MVQFWKGIRTELSMSKQQIRPLTNAIVHLIIIICMFYYSIVNYLQIDYRYHKQNGSNKSPNCPRVDGQPATECKRKLSLVKWKVLVVVYGSYVVIIYCHSLTVLIFFKIILKESIQERKPKTIVIWIIEITKQRLTYNLSFP